MGFFDFLSKSRKVTQRVAETAIEVDGFLAGIELIKRDISRFNGRVLPQDALIDILNDLDRIQEQLGALRK